MSVDSNGLVAWVSAYAFDEYSLRVAIPESLGELDIDMLAQIHKSVQDAVGGFEHTLDKSSIRHRDPNLVVLVSVRLIGLSQQIVEQILKTLERYLDQIKPRLAPAPAV